MDEDKKKVVMIVIIVLCIGLAAGITYWANRGGSSRKKISGIPMACANSKCGYTTELTIKEFKKLMDGKRRDTSTSNITSIAPSAFECPECGKMSLFTANKCEKCGEIFLTDFNSRDYTDRCPKCGYSKIEEELEARKEARRKSRSKE